MNQLQRESRLKMDGRTYHQGSSATKSGWLKIFAALALLLVGSGSPSGVYVSHMTFK